MQRALILLAYVPMALSAALPDGLLPQLEGRIVGGELTTINQFPYQISLQRSGAHSCGGSIYSEKIVITAAHCLISANATVLKVRAGSSYWTSGGVSLAVADFKCHEDYDAYTSGNDIAIIKLATSLSYSSTIRSIPLTTDEPANGAPAVVTGWGALQSEAGSIPMQLHKVEVNIVERTECDASLHSYGYGVGESMICALSAEKDSCQGDSGGPLASGGQLVGVVSWGIACAFKNTPGVYADVAFLKTWVVETVKSI